MVTVAMIIDGLASLSRVVVPFPFAPWPTAPGFEGKRKEEEEEEEEEKEKGEDTK